MTDARGRDRNKDETEINLKQLSISNANYTISFHSLINNMTWVSFSCRATPSLSDLLLSASWFLKNVFLFDAVLVRVDSSRRRLLCVRAVSLERDPESAAGPRLCVEAGWTWCWRRVRDPGSVGPLSRSCSASRLLGSSQ